MQSAVISFLFVLVGIYGQLYNQGSRKTNLFLCICKELPDVLFGCTYVFVQDFRTIDNFGFASVEHLSNLTREEGFSRTRRAMQQYA
jgi:hypothetical protein